MAVTKVEHGKYRIRVSGGYENGKQTRISETYKGTLAGAKKREKEMKAEIDNRKRQLTSEDILMSELFNRYVEDVKRKIDVGQLHKTHYVKGTRAAIGRARNFFENKTIREIDAKSLYEWIDSMRSDGLKNKTIKNYFTEFSDAIRYAESQGIVTRQFITDVVEVIELPKTNKEESEYYTRDEVEAILRELSKEDNQRLKVGAYLALFCGLRQSEIIGLDIEDCDYEKDVISVNKAAHSIGGEVVLDKPKSDRSARKVPFPTYVKEEITKLLNIYREEELIYGVKLLDGALLKTSTKSRYGIGERMRPEYLKKAFKEITVRAGVSSNGKNLHACRHYFASELISSGTDFESVTRIMGHGSLTTTANIYAHPLNDDNKIIIDKVINDRIESIKSQQIGLDNLINIFESEPED